MRIQIDMQDKQVEALRQLMRVTGIATKKDLFNHALSLLQWAVSESQKGNSIASVNGKEHICRVCIMPALQAAQETSASTT